MYQSIRFFFFFLDIFYFYFFTFYSWPNDTASHVRTPYPLAPARCCRRITECHDVFAERSNKQVTKIAIHVSERLLFIFRISGTFYFEKYQLLSDRESSWLQWWHHVWPLGSKAHLTTCKFFCVVCVSPSFEIMTYRARQYTT